MQSLLYRLAADHTGRTPSEYLQIVGLYALMALGVVGTLVGAIGIVARL